MNMCLTHQLKTQFDETKADGFAERLIGILNEGALSLMISIGHRTGLFDALSEMGTGTSAEIARWTGLQERYVREWLGAVATGKIVEYDPARDSYSLPAEHAAFLTRTSTPDNIAVFAQYIGILGAVEDDIVECFRNGGGVSYEKFPRFHSVMAEDSGQTVLSSLLEHILPLMPGMLEKLRSGIRVLDVGCGRGKALLKMAEAFPASRFIGFDLSENALAWAREEADLRGLSNISFETRDLSDFNETAPEREFDLIFTFDAIHDQAKPLNVLRGIERALKNDGVYMMQDIHSAGRVDKNMEHPIAPLLYTLSCMHCMTVSLAQDGDGLGAMWGREKAAELLSIAGFTQVDVHRLEHDFQNDYYVIQK